MRQRLEDMNPLLGTKLRIFFPHGGSQRTLTAMGEFRPTSTPTGPGVPEFLFRNETGHLEWVPGWYVAVPLR